MREIRNFNSDLNHLKYEEDCELKKMAQHAIERAQHAEMLLDKINKMKLNDISGVSKVHEILQKRWEK